MIVSSIEATIVMPEVILLVTACSALMVDAFSNKKNAFGGYYLGLVGILATLAMTLANGLTIFSHNDVTTIFNSMYIFDRIAVISKFFILINLFAIFIYSRQYVSDRSMPHSEYFVLSLFATLGMLIMVSAHSLLTLYLGLELMSLPLYAMVAMNRTSPQSSEAAMKYFVMGALASGMLLYGMSILYGITNSLDLSIIAQTILQQGLAHNWVLIFALVFLIAGLAFKVGAVPFHMWIPDIYQGAPAAVTLLVASAPKIAAMVMMTRVLVGALPDLISQWQGIIVLLAVLSMSLGNFAAIMQTNIKRLLAYSAIAHMGYMLLGILSGTAQGYSAALFYIVIYSIMSLGGFGMVVLLSREGFELELIEDLRGLNTRNPWLAFMMMLLMFSMAGIPPTVGFFAKLSVLQAVIQAGYVWLAVLALLFAIVGAYYYIRVIRVMYFDEPLESQSFVVSKPAMALMSVNGLSMLALGLAPGMLIRLCQASLGIG